MPSINLKIGGNVRNTHQRVKGLTIAAGLSPHNVPQHINGVAVKDIHEAINFPDWSYDNNTGIVPQFKRHNAVHNQERIDRMVRGQVLRYGMVVKYYTTTFDPSQDPLYHEDNNRVIDRVFEIPITAKFQQFKDLFNRWGIQAMDKDESFVHMSLFLEMNYASLKREGIVPKCNSTIHNPIYSQRGYDDFAYHGYTAEQIFPKKGDKMKFESTNAIYNVENVQPANQEQYMWYGRHYFWRLMIAESFDSGEIVGDSVKTDPNNGNIITNMFGQMDIKKSGAGYAFDVSNTVNNLKKDILFLSPEVDPNTTDISKDPNWYPAYTKLGGW
jgi:hypothetical protein